MTAGEESAFRLKRPSRPLPTHLDFGYCGDTAESKRYPYLEDLDAKYAWEHFGDLSLDRAYELFVSNPLNYLEDFMWMGSRAFEYYLPVIDRYLREVSGGDELDDCFASSLGCAVDTQLGRNDSNLSSSVVLEISELSTFVRANLARFSPSPKGQRQIDRAWQHVDEEVSTYEIKRDQRKLEKESQKSTNLKKRRIGRRK